MKILYLEVEKSKFNYRIILAITVLFSNVMFSQLLGQHVLNGPYLLEPGETEMIIRWEFDGMGNYTMEYGEDISKTAEVDLIYRENKHGGYLYEGRLEKLNANSKYNYRLMSQNDSKWYEFRTYKHNQDKMSFVAMGDSRSNPDIFSKIMEETESEHPDFIISMGDLVEVGAEYDEWNDFYFDGVKDIVSSIPLVSTLGDHETNGDNGDMFRYFLRKDETVEKLWFSFDYGIAHFISLDYRHSDDKEMIDWFINDISSSDKQWNFVYMHRGAYNLGGHRSNWGRGIWPELFSKYNVDIVFAGHSHIYERFFPVREKGAKNAVCYITTGGAGAGLYETVANDAIMAKNESVNHYVTIQIDKNLLLYRANRMDGSLLDEFEIKKNKNGYDKTFENMVIPQELLNTITGFNTAVSNDLSEIPLFEEAAVYDLEIQSSVSIPIPFSMKLTDKSAETYSMQPYKDTLQANQRLKAAIEITRKKDMIIHPWGNFDPELRFVIIYEYNSEKDTIVGKANDYYPDRY